MQIAILQYPNGDQQVIGPEEDVDTLFQMAVRASKKAWGLTEFGYLDVIVDLYQLSDEPTGTVSVAELEQITL